MARRPRIEFPGALYHVIARGNNRAAIFRDDADRAAYLARLARYQRETACLVHAYVLMPNHVHLLLESRETPLSLIMQRLQQTYTQYFNRRHRRIGHVFQGRYKAILCDRDAYLLELIRYLHLNPVRAGLVQDPADFPWTSHRVYLGQARSPIAVETTSLGLLSPDVGRARRLYRQFVLEGLGAGHQDSLYQLVDQRILGDERFADAVLSRSGKPGPTRPLLRQGLPNLLKVISRKAGIPTTELMEKSRRADPARDLFIYIAIQHAGHRRGNVAAFLQRDPGAISHALRRIRRRLADDRSARSLLGRVLAARS